MRNGVQSVKLTGVIVHMVGLFLVEKILPAFPAQSESPHDPNRRRLNRYDSVVGHIDHSFTIHERKVIT